MAEVVHCGECKQVIDIKNQEHVWDTYIEIYETRWASAVLIFLALSILLVLIISIFLSTFVYARSAISRALMLKVSIRACIVAMWQSIRRVLIGEMSKRTER